MSQIDPLGVHHRRRGGGTTAIRRFVQGGAVAKVPAWASVCLVCLALGSPTLRADTRPGVGGANRSHPTNARTARPIGPAALPATAYGSQLGPPSDSPGPMPCGHGTYGPIPYGPRRRSLAGDRPVRLPSTGVRQAGAVSVEMTRVDGGVGRARRGAIQQGSPRKPTSQLLQPSQMSALLADRVAFPNAVARGPLPFSEGPARSGDETGMPAAACAIDLPPIGAVTTDIRPPEGELPPDCARTKLPALGQVTPGGPEYRPWPQILYPWEATSYCHRPLYFEEINLERYGYPWCDPRCGGVPAALVQPVLSGAHFFATVPLLPYKMTVDRPYECIYTLGHYRPGSPVPHQIHRMPLRAVPAGVEGVAITGLILAIP